MGNGAGTESEHERRSRVSDQGFHRKPIEITGYLPSIRTFGGYHSIHLSYGRDVLILQEVPCFWRLRWLPGGVRTGCGHLASVAAAPGGSF